MLLFYFYFSLFFISLSYVFWTDIIKHSIMRANLDGTNVKEIIDHGIVRPGNIISVHSLQQKCVIVSDVPPVSSFIRLSYFTEGIAVDWVHNLIYWVDNSLKRIEVANLNGGQRTILFSDLHSPKDIIVDPINQSVN